VGVECPSGADDGAWHLGRRSEFRRWGGTREDIQFLFRVRRQDVAYAAGDFSGWLDVESLRQIRHRAGGGGLEGDYIAANGSALRYTKEYFYWYQAGRVPQIGLWREGFELEARFLKRVPVEAGTSAGLPILM